jgi:hypothetical protein
MPTKSSKPTNPSPPAIHDGPTTAATKSASTVQRHKDERRAERLSEIRGQTAAGTLVIRQMTVEEHDAASELARETRTRNEARLGRYRAPGER